MNVQRLDIVLVDFPYAAGVGSNVRIGLPLRALRWPDFAPVVLHQRFVEAGTAIGLIRDEQDPSGFDLECPKVEQLVVKDAEIEAIHLDVRAAGLVPTDVGSVKAKGNRASPHVEATDSTAVFGGNQDTLSELWIAQPLRRLAPCH